MESSFMSLARKSMNPYGLLGAEIAYLELYPEFLKHLKKYVSFLNKPRSGTNPTSPDSSNGSATKSTVEPDNQSKATSTANSDTSELNADLPDVSKNSSDSQLEKSNKNSKPCRR